MLKGIQYPFSNNPYSVLWKEALYRRGVSFKSPLTLLAFFKEAFFVNKPNLVHLHWVHPVGKNLLISLFKFVIFQLTVLIFWLRRVKIYWTIHNLEPHEKKHIWLDSINNFLLAKYVTSVFVHGVSAIPIIVKKIPSLSGKIYCAFHGNYNEIISLHCKRTGGAVSEGRCFLYFGLIRSYKGVLDLIEQYSKISETGTLIIVGQPYSLNIKIAIEKLAEKDARVILKFGYLDHDDLVSYICDADVVVLPFKEVFTSGSLMLAMTLGKPVIVPKIGLLTEYVSDDCAFMYEDISDCGLYEAIRTAFNASDETLRSMGSIAKRRADNFSWDATAVSIVNVYQQH